VFGTYYLPEAVLEEKKTDHYKQWAAEGWLTITDGDEIDLNMIQEDITGWEENGKSEGGLIRNFQVEEVAYDPWQATQLAQNLAAEGATVVEYRNTVANFSAPMKEIEGAAKAGRLHHNGDPVLAWMVSNVVAKEDAKENIYPRKETPENKIDGVIALISAIGRAMHATPAAEPSIYVIG
jgi:phage terminase large subunit-like protein